MTRAEVGRRFVRQIGTLYERHPYYLVGGRPHASLDLAGHHISFDGRGYRGHETVMPKPAGVYRVVCIGGSTTFDLLAANDESTWPELLAKKLGRAFDVVNAGFPGWTTAESLISLELRDVDVKPDLVIVYAGLNDLQPASHRPFTRDYSKGHGDILPRVLGVDPLPAPFASRSLLVEWLLDHFSPHRNEVPTFSPVFRWNGQRVGDLPEETFDVFARNLRTIAAVSRAHGAEVLFVPQVVRVRPGIEFDRTYIESWVPGLTTEGILRGLARDDETTRAVAASIAAPYVDPFATHAFVDSDFSDPAHFAAGGSERFAAAVEPVVRAIASRQQNNRP